MALLYRLGNSFTTRHSLFAGTPRRLFAAMADPIPPTLHKYNRLKPLAKALKVNPDTLMKDICVKRRKQFFCNHGGAWFSFPSMNSIIVPFETAQAVAAKYGISVQLAPDLTVSRKTVSSKLPVVAFLGHYNHGKTSLLDALASTAFVSREKHGITQVNSACLQRQGRVFSEWLFTR
jgi:hypothetical protein